MKHSTNAGEIAVALVGDIVGRGRLAGADDPV